MELAVTLTYKGVIHSGAYSQYNQEMMRLKVENAAGSVHGADLYLRGWLHQNTTLNIFLNQTNAMRCTIDVSLKSPATYCASDVLVYHMGRRWLCAIIELPSIHLHIKANSTE